MKYLLIVVVVLAVIWFLRTNRRGSDDKPKDAPRQDALAEPQDMVRCPVCSLHLPRTDALPGKDGRLYCCADHRLRAGD
jgi:uncharacterized protein